MKEKTGGYMKLCIIGAGDAGKIAAVQARRIDKTAQIDIFSKREEMGCPPCEMPLVLSGDIASWKELARGLNALDFYEKRNITIHFSAEVADILRGEKQIIVGEGRYRYDKLILALGATSRMPSIPGMNSKNEFFLTTDIADGKALERNILNHNTAAIIGGGFIALEIAMALKRRNYSKVYLVIRNDLMRAYLDEDMTQKLRQEIVSKGVELIMPAKIRGISSKNGKKLIILSDREIKVDFIFFGTGSEPNAALARKAKLKIGESDGISVNQYLQTSDSDIYSAGDCMENWDLITGSKRRHQLAPNAIRTGYIAGRNAVSDNKITYGGTVMPFVTKIFDYEVGSVGFTEKEAKVKEIIITSVVVNTPFLRQSRGGKPAQYKLIADSKTHALIGAQVISEETISGTIDKLAVAIANKMPIQKLLQIDSCYSPHVQEDQIAVPIQRLIDRID
jgi:NADPH-dependent 2,4-dienoyl-CoA reductase/sulfur reductase-like enzyme